MKVSEARNAGMEAGKAPAAGVARSRDYRKSIPRRQKLPCKTFRAHADVQIVVPFSPRFIFQGIRQIPGFARALQVTLWTRQTRKMGEGVEERETRAGERIKLPVNSVSGLF